MRNKHDRQTYENGGGFGRCAPDADADPGGGDGPDDVAAKEDDDEAEEVGGHGDGEAGPGVAGVVFGVRGVVREPEGDAAKCKL